MSDPTFLYSENRVAKKIGLSRAAMRALREKDLQEGVDWEQKNGGEVLLSGIGVNHLTELTKPANFDPEACRVQKNGEHPKRKKMKVVPPMSMNPRVVLAEGEDGERHLVEVGKNATFCFDDEIEVEPHDVQTGIWKLVSAVPRDRRRPLHA